MKIIADLQVHSKYSRAVSQKMNIEEMYNWSILKGINLVATGDWTHPLWIREIKEKLVEDGSGTLKLKPSIEKTLSEPPIDNGKLRKSKTRFLLATEISSIYKQGGTSRRIHNLLWVPTINTAEEIIQKLLSRGCNLGSDGRPIVGLSSREIVDIALSVDEKALVIPAHCLLPGTLIHTLSGVIPIDKLQRGDSVLTHKGRFQKVTKPLKRRFSGNIYYIKPWYFTNGLAATGEHPFLAIKTVKKCRSTGYICIPSGKHVNRCKVRHYKSYKRQWIQAKHIEKGDILLYPRLKATTKKRHVKISDYVIRKPDNSSIISSGELEGGHITKKKSRITSIKNIVKINSSFCRLVGYFLAGGYIDSKGRISFAFNHKKRACIKDVKACMDSVFGLNKCREHRRSPHGRVELIYYSKILAEFLSGFCYDDSGIKRAYTKRVPDFFLTLPKSLQAELIRGWWRGDRGYTTSRALMNQLKTIFIRLGIIPSIYIFSKNRQNSGKRSVSGRIIAANSDLFHLARLSFLTDPYNLREEKEFSQFVTKLDRRHGWIDENYVYLPVRKIEKKRYKGHVYNLEVEGDNSYTSEFACVHNCWTPWFALYGSKSGFDYIEECFAGYSKHIYAIETGLSSDPAMNWRIKDLDNRSILSFSDAHSGPKLGREATVFNLNKLTYDNLREAIIERNVLCTFEFYPEEGKYHWSGHRACNIRQSPEQTRELGTTCPVCGKPMTIGVEHRVEMLAGRDQIKPVEKKDECGVRWLYHPEKKHPPFVNLVPLLEILSEALKVGSASKRVQIEYKNITENLGSEFHVLLKEDIAAIEKISGEHIAEAIQKVRAGDVFVDPGYDGVFGTVKVWKGKKDKVHENSEEQMGLF